MQDLISIYMNSIRGKMKTAPQSLELEENTVEIIISEAIEGLQIADIHQQSNLTKNDKIKMQKYVTRGKKLKCYCSSIFASIQRNITL